MPRSNKTRRDFLKQSARLAAAAVTTVAAPSILIGRHVLADSSSANIVAGAIGLGGRGSNMGNKLRTRGTLTAICDVDSERRGRFEKNFGHGQRFDQYSDYRKLIDRKDIDVISIGTPDHWHTAICLYALRAGKDVYCEKPLSLTIEEGKMIRKAVEETGRILQVGTQQRSQYEQRYIEAKVLIQSGRLGKIKRITTGLGEGPVGGPFKTAKPPANLDWDMWLGQTPAVPYTPERCHGNFRWWYEYAGGKVTDFGAHHIDIAQWALGLDDTGPSSVEPIISEHPPHARENAYNTATRFKVRCRFKGGAEILILSRLTDEHPLVQKHKHRGGVLIEGSEASLWVTRSFSEGPILDEIRHSKKESAWLAEEVAKFFPGRPIPKFHMDNFLHAVKDRKPPIAPVTSHHRTLTTCHLANIALRTKKRILWDPKREQAIGDRDINQNWLGREQRKGYEVRDPG